MEQCEFCGNYLPTNTNFCGKCGRIPRRISQQSTRLSDSPGLSEENDIESLPTVNLGDVLGSNEPTSMMSTTGRLRAINLIPLESEDEEEEKRRRAALLGLGLPLLGQQPHGHVPAVHGTPQVQQIPSVQGTPQVQQIPSVQGTPQVQPPSGVPGAQGIGKLSSSPFHASSPHTPIHSGPSHTPIHSSSPHAPIHAGSPHAPIHSGSPKQFPNPSPHAPIHSGTPGQFPNPSPHTPIHSGAPSQFPNSSPHTPIHSGWPNTPIHSGAPGQFPNPSPHTPLGPMPNSPGSLGPKPIGSGSSKKAKGGPSGYLVGGIVAVVSIVLILASIIGLGLTVWAPSLALSGSSSVSPGSTLSLHGSGFWPNSSVTLILDTNIPIDYLQSSAPTHLTERYAQLADSAGQMLLPAPKGNHNTITAQGDGAFAISFLVDPSWSLGRHIIHANESTTHRSAELPFTITQTNAMPSPTTGTTPTLGVTPTATASPTSSPSLSCASPANLALGPVHENSSQTASGSITLCTSGSGQLTWSASWNASWLKLSQNSGAIQAPDQAQVTATASAANLAKGNYSTTITFSSPEANTSQTVTVSFTVQTECVNATPTSMGFNGVANVSDPTSSQTITVTNCGIASNWSAKVRNGSYWLSISPSGGTLSSGATSQITVTASNLNAELQAGSYSDFIDITIGSKTASVSVTLDVQSQPLISASPTAVGTGSAACTRNSDSFSYACTITLTNSSSTVSLDWTASSDVSSGVSIVPSSGTIAAGSTETVIITFTFCSTADVTFTGPGPNNSATVTWTCIS
jgi:hypothetical protein